MGLDSGNINAFYGIKEGLNIWCQALQVLPVQLILMSDREIEHRAYSLKRKKNKEERSRGGAEIRELRSDQGIDDISWSSCQGNTGADNPNSDKSSPNIKNNAVAVSQSADYTRTYMDDTVRERENIIEIFDLPGGSRMVTINSRVFIVGSEESAYSSSDQCKLKQKADKKQKPCQNLGCPKAPKLGCPNQPISAPPKQSRTIASCQKPTSPLKKQQCVPHSINSKEKAAPAKPLKQPQSPSSQQAEMESPGIVVANFKVITPNNQTFIIKFVDARNANNNPQKGALQSPNHCSVPVKPSKSPCQIENRSKTPVDPQQEMLCPNLPSGPGTCWHDPEPYETQRFGGIKGVRRVFEGEKDGRKIRGEVIMAGRPMNGGCMKVGESRFDSIPEESPCCMQKS